MGGQGPRAAGGQRDGSEGAGSGAGSDGARPAHETAAANILAAAVRQGLNRPRARPPAARAATALVGAPRRAASSVGAAPPLPPPAEAGPVTVAARALRAMVAGAALRAISPQAAAQRRLLQAAAERLAAATRPNAAAPSGFAAAVDAASASDTRALISRLATALTSHAAGATPRAVAAVSRAGSAVAAAEAGAAARRAAERGVQGDQASDAPMHGASEDVMGALWRQAAAALTAVAAVAHLQWPEGERRGRGERAPGAGLAAALRVWASAQDGTQASHEARRRAGALLDAAVSHAARAGFSLMEGYPIDTAATKKAPADLYMGTVEFFEDHGFEEVERRGGRPIVRKAV